MIDTYALTMNGVILWLSGFLIGIGLKTIIDGFARRDDFDRRLGGIENRLDDHDEDHVGHWKRLDELEDQAEAIVKAFDRHTDWLVDIEESLDPPDDDEPGKPEVDAEIEIPPLTDHFGDYHRFISPPAHND